MPTLKQMIEQAVRDAITGLITDALDSVIARVFPGAESQTLNTLGVGVVILTLAAVLTVHIGRKHYSTNTHGYTLDRYLTFRVARLLTLIGGLFIIYAGFPLLEGGMTYMLAAKSLAAAIGLFFLRGFATYVLAGVLGVPVYYGLYYLGSGLKRGVTAFYRRVKQELAKLRRQSPS